MSLNLVIQNETQTRLFDWVVNYLFREYNPLRYNRRQQKPIQRFFFVPCEIKTGLWLTLSDNFHLNSNESISHSSFNCRYPFYRKLNCFCIIYVNFYSINPTTLWFQKLFTTNFFFFRNRHHNFICFQ